jgi:hypothetical protein
LKLVSAYKPPAPLVEEPSRTAAGDFDGDGVPDLAIAGRGIAVLYGPNAFDQHLLARGDARRVDIAGSVGSIGGVVSADWDRDGTADLAALIFFIPNSTSSVSLAFLRVLGGRSFGVEMFPLDGNNWSGILLSGDWNVDGRIDYLLVRGGSEVVSLLNMEQGALLTSAESPVPDQ